MPYSISPETANEAYAQAAKNAEQSRTLARLYDCLADHLGGAFITCKLADKAAKVFPAYNVRYFKYYGGRKALILTDKADKQQSYSLGLGPKEDRYLNADALRKEAERERQQAATYQAALADFWEYLGRYNVLTAELEKARAGIATVMYCSPRHCTF